MDKVKRIIDIITRAPVRKAIYGLVAAGFTLAFALGFFTEQDQALVNTALDNAYQLLTALASFMAMTKTGDAPVTVEAYVSEVTGGPVARVTYPDGREEHFTG